MWVVGQTTRRKVPLHLCIIFQLILRASLRYQWDDSCGFRDKRLKVPAGNGSLGCVRTLVGGVRRAARDLGSFESRRGFGRHRDGEDNRGERGHHRVDATHDAVLRRAG